MSVVSPKASSPGISPNFSRLDSKHKWYLSFCWHQIQIFWHQKDTELQNFTPIYNILTPDWNFGHLHRMWCMWQISGMVPSTSLFQVHISEDIKRYHTLEFRSKAISVWGCGFTLHFCGCFGKVWNNTSADEDTYHKLTQISTDSDTNLYRFWHKSLQMQTQISTDADTNHTSSFSAVSQYSKTCLYVPSHDHDHFCQSSEKSSGRNPQVHDYAKTQKSRLEVLGIN